MAKLSTDESSIPATTDRRRMAAIQKVREIIAEFNLTLGEIRPPMARTKRIKLHMSEIRARVMYRDPATGQTWDGIGAAPQWLVEYEKNKQNRDKFLIKTGFGRHPIEDRARRAAAKKAAKKTVKKAAKKR